MAKDNAVYKHRGITMRRSALGDGTWEILNEKNEVIQGGINKGATARKFIDSMLDGTEAPADIPFKKKAKAISRSNSSLFRVAGDGNKPSSMPAYHGKDEEWATDQYVMIEDVEELENERITRFRQEGKEPGLIVYDYSGISSCAIEMFRPLRDPRVSDTHMCSCYKKYKSQPAEPSEKVNYPLPNMEHVPSYERE